MSTQLTRPVFEWKQEDEEEERKDRKIDVSRVKVTPIDVSTALRAQNSQHLFMGQLEELNVSSSGGTAEQSKQLKQLVDKWCCERNTFESGGSGAERLEHAVASFILPTSNSNGTMSTRRARSQRTITAS